MVETVQLRSVAPSDAEGGAGEGCDMRCDMRCEHCARSLRRIVKSFHWYLQVQFHRDKS